VAGDAALTFDPHDEAGLAACLHLLAGQEELRAELRRRGVARARGFSWQRTARETVAVYDKI
jgi:glycosyltransferase involved in cell wall biosynthesis